jgi:membrane-associated phospholipid phosphatase
MLLPASLRWLGQFTLAAALLCPLAYWGLDHPLATWIAHYLSSWQAPVATLTALLDAVVQGPLFYLHGLLTLVVLLLGARLLSRRPLFTLLLTMVLLRVSSEISANLLKSFVQRARPGSYAGFPDSFPSGHTTIYFGTFLLFAACFPTYRGWWLVVPTFIALGRLVGSLHYLSDVCAGMVLAGVLTSLWLSLAYLVDRPLWRQVQAISKAKVVTVN